MQGTRVVDHLQHACKVVLQGHSFLCQLINLLCTFCRDDHPVCLNQEFVLDLAWWQEFSCLGIVAASFTTLWAPLPDFKVSSDASGALGYGTVFQGHDGFQVHGSQHRSLSQSSTRHFSLSSWQPISGVPYGPPNGSPFYQITAQWWKFCV